MSSLCRSAFQALDFVAKMSHIRSGFKIIDDEPVVDPYADALRIVDGRQRLAWIETKRKQIEREAENAKPRAAAGE